MLEMEEVEDFEMKNDENETILLEKMTENMPENMTENMIENMTENMTETMTEDKTESTFKRKIVNENVISDAMKILAYKTLVNEHIANKALIRVLQSYDIDFNSLGLIESMLDEIKQFVYILEISGFEKISQLCKSIINQDCSTFTEVNAWNVCAISCNVNSSMIQVNMNNCILNVHSKFSQFIYCLWLCTHIKHIELSRIQKLSHSLDIYGNEAFLFLLNKPIISCKQNIEKYKHSFEYVFEVFRLTIEEASKIS